MDLKVEVFPQVERSNFIIVISSDKIILNCNFNPRDKSSKNLKIDLLKIKGADRCIFTMGSEDIDTYLLKNSHKPLDKRWYTNVIRREKDEYELQLPNVRVYMKYDEAVEFYEIVDSLDDAIKNLSSTYS